MLSRGETAIAVGSLLLLAVLGWLVKDQLELKTVAEQRVSPAALKDPMLGASALLRGAGHPVVTAPSLGTLNFQQLPGGVLIVGESAGITLPATAAQALAWVRQGNMLVTQPRLATDHERELRDDPEHEDEAEESDQIETDPIAARYGVVRDHAPARTRPCSPKQEKAGTTTVPARPRCTPLNQYRPPTLAPELPGFPYPLVIDHGDRLFSTGGGPDPLWADTSAGSVRAYAEGKGLVVIVAGDYFTNRKLQQHDHGELLLKLAALQGQGARVTLVKNVAMLKWYQALWHHFSYLLIALALCIALLLWRGLRRFGPMLPMPDVERRSLMEHIAASGAWLWKTGDGRALLLDAARQETLALIRRRAPALMRKSPGQLAAALARGAGLDPVQLHDALHGDAARKVPHFTRQIRLLQELRNHHER